MTAQLPTSPSLKHLKLEAKNLLKAHRRREPSCCDVLRHLGKFNGRSADEMLAAEVGLQEMQFALAVAYGFKTWKEMRDAVDRGTATGIKRAGEKVWLDGVQQKRGKTSVIAVLARCLQYMGIDTSYEELMGLGSHAFRMQFDWCPSAPHSFCGFNTSDPALRAFGYRLTRYSTARPSHRDDLDDPEDLTDALKAVMLSIETGRPGLMDWEESRILGGYTKPDKQVTGLLNIKGEPIEKLPWSVGIIDKIAKPPAKRESILWSLRTAVSHLHSETLSGISFDEQKQMTYPAGMTAWQNWIDAMAPDAKPVPKERGSSEYVGIKEMDKEWWFGFCIGNAWTYECLMDARFAASKYLCGIAEELSEARDPILEAADNYEQLGHALKEGAPNIVYPWQTREMTDWSDEMRAGQADALRKAFALDQAAVKSLERALSVIESNSSTERTA